MRRLLATLFAFSIALGVLGAGPASAHPRRSHGLPDLDLPAAGIQLEGIGYDKRAGLIYVSGVNDGGQIYRAKAGSEQLEVWQPGNADGRTTARGIDVDDKGRVFVAGGPTALAWVFARDGQPLATVSAGTGVNLNDVWVGNDGAAYVTNSSEAEIYRITDDGAGNWTMTLWLDASGEIPVTIGPNSFNLNGIVGTPNGKYLIVAQTNTGQLWRVDLSTRDVTEIDLGGERVMNADGLVLRGNTLFVVRNFAHLITEIRLEKNASTGTIRDELATPADRTFTTAKLVRGRLLAVDSQFGQPEPWPAEDRVVALETP